MQQPILYQRIEGATILLASLYFYAHLNFSWLLFALLVFTIDVFMIGYLTKSKQVGAHIYNAGHSLIIPLILLVIGTLTSNNLLVGGGLIWVAHIGLDRMFGYGLKFGTGFKDTHLGKIGKN